MTTLFHVADLHFGREDRAAIDAFTRAVAVARPGAILVTGDLTMRARSAEFAAAAVWLTGLDTPLSVEVGNHDLPYFNPWSRFVTPYRRFGRLASAIERPIGLPDVGIIPLRTTARFQWRLNWAHGLVPSARVSVAEAQLAAVPPGRVRIVACHHPLVDTAAGIGEGRTRGGRDALVRLAAAGTDLVVSGHVHDPFDLIFDGGVRPVRMVGAGTLSERVRGTRPSFNRITIAGGAIDVKVVEL